jgi:Carboxypeptidase regulatory-like domain/TonB-dependent Receptor Plug Domain/TonB dependent receptor
VILLASPRIYPQVVGATLSGTVTDQSDAVIPSAQVSTKNIATGVTRAVLTDPAGFYTAPNLLPGSYEITATASGFSTEVQTGVTLTVGAQQVLNFTLKVGTVTEKIQVAGEAPTVQLATSSLSAVVNSATVRELPLNGRSWTDLATLQPGVSGIQTQAAFAAGPDRGRRGFGAQISISGARPQQNNYRLDGISLNDYANGAPGSVLGGNLGVDAIEEFSVLTSNYSAEYGKTSGGVVNAITHSGTNQFHGSVYEFLRNSALDARNFFDKGSIPPFKQNQFGASADGPIRRDRTFLFGDYEGIRNSKGITQVNTVPSPAARAGNLSTGTVAVDPSAQKYLGLYPLPNGPILPPGDTGIFSFAGQQVVNENFSTTRVDQRFSQKDSLFGSYMYDDTSFTAPDSLNDLLNGHHTNRQVVVLEEDHIFTPNLVNSVRFGFSRAGIANLVGLKALNPLAGDPSLGAVPGQNAAALIVGSLAPQFKGGLGGAAHQLYIWNSFQGYDDAFLTYGTHSLKFGAALERMQINSLEFATPSGVFNFGSLSDFLTNHPQRFQAGFPQTTTPRGLRETLFGAYVQDDWRWHPNLTLNLGLRYEMTTVLAEVQDKLATLINLTDPAPHLGSPFFLNPTLRNFEPRVGFAWDPFHNGKTAVRGGFGIFDVLPLPYEFYSSVGSAAPFYSQGGASHLPPGSLFYGSVSVAGRELFAHPLG